MHPSTFIALFLPAYAALGTTAPGDVASAPDGRESLQEFLARLRAQRDSLLAEMRATVEERFAALEQQVQSRDPAVQAEARRKLVALGPESAPLLVEKIDPGEKPTEPVRLRARFVADALIEMPTRAITTRLIEIARTGSPDGKLNALRLLGFTPEPERAAPVLTEIYRASHGEQRAAAIGALARLGGPANENVLVEALSDPNPEIVRLTLVSLGDAHNVAIAPKVLALIEKSPTAIQLIPGFVGYYRGAPAAVDKTHLLALVRLAQNFSASMESRIQILELLPQFADKIDSDVKKELRQAAGSPSGEIREAALVALCQLGDKNARRELLDGYDDQIERNKNWAQNYEARANVLYRIGEWRDAIKDYQQALRLSVEDIHARTDNAHIGIARCWAQLGKFKEAALALEKAPISLQQLGELSKEPAFAKMAKDPKYKDLFRLD